MIAVLTLPVLILTEDGPVSVTSFGKETEKIAQILMSVMITFVDLIHPA